MSLFYLITSQTYNNGTLWTDILFAVCTVIVYGRFEWRLRTLALRVVECAALFLLAELLDVTLNIFGLSGYPAPTYVALFVPHLLYAYSQVRLGPTDRLVRLTTFCSLFMITVGFTRVVVPSIDVLAETEWGYSLTSLISYAAMFAAAFFVRGLNISHFLYVPRNFVFLVVTTDVLGATASQVFVNLRDTFSYFEEQSGIDETLQELTQAVSGVNLIVDVLFMLLVIVAYIMFYSLAEEHDQRAQDLVTRKSDIDNASIAATTKAVYQKLRELRHEIKNHDAYLVSLIDAGEYEKARRFLADQSGERATILRRVTSGNLAIDTVVNAKIALAQSQGVEVETMLAVPAQLPFDEGEIFRLLANLMDNAIEGTVAARATAGSGVAGGDGAAGGKVTLEILPKGGYWFITVRNPCDPARVVRRPDGTLRTSKADAEVHGFGTRVIKRVAERYRGTAQFSVEGGTFTASVMLAQDTAAGTGERKVA